MTDSQEIKAAAILRALGGLVRNIAGVIAAVVLIVNFGGPLLRPVLQSYADSFLVELRGDQVAAQEERSEIREAMRAITLKLDAIEPPPFIRVFGRGAVVDQGPFRPGDRVGVLYLLQRNQPCPSTVQVNFLNRFGLVDRDLSFSFGAARAPVTLEPIPFVAWVTLPDAMPPGRYSYAPTLEPDRDACPRARSVPLVPSDYFEVIDD